MTRAALFEQIKAKSSYLCVGLDTDLDRLPQHLKQLDDPIFEFNKRIIDATAAHCVAYKPNLAFYEALGPKGWESLAKTIDYIPKEIFTIADAKRGDIGNTSRLYAKAFFEQLSFDAVTVAPYMGKDSVAPFLGFQEKWVILLAHTSNPSSADFQLMEEGSSGQKLYEKVIGTSQEWATPDELMYVVGATQADKLAAIRKQAPENFFLVPGVGAQGGDLHAVSKAGMNSQCGLLVNSSRGIIYQSDGHDFATAAGNAAQSIAQEMAKYLDLYL